MVKEHLIYIPFFILILCAFSGEINVHENWMDELVAILKLVIIIAYAFAQLMTLIPRRTLAGLPGIIQSLIAAIAANYYHSHDLERPKKL